ncbi:tryptophan 2,3-dioxygenase-like [Glandiceps talaboti]
MDSVSTPPSSSVPVVTQIWSRANFTRRLTVQSLGDGTSSPREYNAAAKGGLTYGKYLELDKLLSCNTRQSDLKGWPCHDEHLFISVHQVYELWFKQILFEIDSIRHLFDDDCLDERQMLVIISRVNRVVQIMKLLVDQVTVLETMSPLDFADFRSFLTPASGFQSFQFRLLENKLGIKIENRVKYSQQHYSEVFKDDIKLLENLQNSEKEPSLLDLLQRWLARTPGLEKDGFNFWGKFQNNVTKMLEEILQTAQAEDDTSMSEILMSQYMKQKETFDTIFDERKHNELVARGERRFSFKAMHGALMISFYRDEPRFNQPYQLLNLLIDLDSLLIKWRSNHVMLVQRMLGNKPGTGGSSGYHYLRSTVSDRYKVFLDLFNLSSYIVPRQYIPALNSDIRRRLCSMSNGDDESDSADSGTMDDHDFHEAEVMMTIGPQKQVLRDTGNGFVP